MFQSVTLVEGEVQLTPMHVQLPDVPEGDIDSMYSSTLGYDATSLATSILRYRVLHGRTYYGEIGDAQAWEPNDNRHMESMD